MSVTIQYKVGQPDTYMVEYFDGEPDNDRLADVWYQGHGTVAKVVKQEYAILVSCDGDMRYVIDDEVSRNLSLLERKGITNDKELQKANDEGTIDWDMNPWFDLYIPNDTAGSLECVYGDLVEAILGALEYIDSQIAIETELSQHAVLLDK